jgi:N-methylhydantoinase A
VTVPAGGDFGAAFHERHEALYGYRDEGRPLELVNLRLRAVGRGPRPDLTLGACREGEAIPSGSAPVVLDGEPRECPVYERESLPCGGAFAGPALVVEETATHLVRPGWEVRVDQRGNMVVEKQL